MSKRCPNCNEKITYLQVSKQMEGSQRLPEEGEQLHPIEWKPPEEQKEPLIYTCPECLVEIEDETLKEWGLN